MRPLSFSMVIAACLSLPVSGGSAAIAQPFQHKFGELREYHKHWLAVCPNQQKASPRFGYQTTCWASTYITTDGFFLEDRISVARNRTTGKFNITFVNNDQLDRDKPVILKFSSGTRLKMQFETGIETNGNTINELRIVDRRDIAKIIEGMKAANRMSVTWPTSGGPRKLVYSMIGFKSAMVFLRQYAN